MKIFNLLILSLIINYSSSKDNDTNYLSIISDVNWIKECAPSEEITITQSGNFYPNYNTNPIPPDGTGMNTATEIASRIKLGWNIGNTLEAIGGELFGAIRK